MDAVELMVPLMTPVVALMVRPGGSPVADQVKTVSTVGCKTLPAGFEWRGAEGIRKSGGDKARVGERRKPSRQVHEKPFAIVGVALGFKWKIRAQLARRCGVEK
jgi:hypothetical protein